MTDPVLLHHLSSIQNHLRNMQTDVREILDKHDKRIEEVEDSQKELEKREHGRNVAIKMMSVFAVGVSSVLSFLINKLWP